MPIELTFITHGPNKGKSSWKITADKKLVERGRVRQWGQSNGIADNERIARSTATRQLRWHGEREDQL
jgi:hypothetical protein